MKNKNLSISIVAICLLLISFKLADDIITRLGMQHQNAQWHIIRNLIGSFDTGPMELGVEGGDPNSIYRQTQSFRIPTARLLPNIIAGDKAAASKELCEYLKKYVNSVEFAAEYTKLRESAIPLTDRGMSLADLKRNSEVFRLNIKNYPNDIKYVAEQQKQLDENEKRVTALQEAAKKPFQGKDAWEKMYPADPAVMVKKRLQEYLQLAATVDFTAKLTDPDKYKVKKFVNPAYEKKSLKWKAIYRAGKEVNDAVTVFVKEWLKGEIIAKEKTTMAVTTPAANTPPPTAATKPASQSEPVAGSGPVVTSPESAPTEKKQSGSKLKDKLKSIIRN
ncbi:MAG TPA: hypothetical protein PKG90_13825 [Chitinophagaceae bacterium]|nr:hypothetical protein [Chitinophagaceae bacterium]HNU16002.1 hypothetical protein [Chitinophagaceae bacterium]